MVCSSSIEGPTAAGRGVKICMCVPLSPQTFKSTSCLFERASVVKLFENGGHVLFVVVLIEVKCFGSCTCSKSL